MKEQGKAPARRCGVVALRAVTAALVALALAGCSGIPREGPVVPGRPMGNDPREGMVGFIADPPQPGASPEATVFGFLRAAVAGFGQDHRTARSFLAPDRRLTWRPDASVVVYPGQTTPTPVQVPVEQPSAGPSATPSTTPSVTPSATTAATPAATSAPGEQSRTRVRVKVPVEATIDGDGRYTVAAPGQSQEVTYGLVTVDGEWRIDDVPDGILVSATDFAVTFKPFPVYFPDVGQRYLVPDIHWFPGERQVPTALVEALLDGPPKWLEGAVTTGAPAGTQMAVGAVVVSGETATVDLDDRARSASPRQRQLLARQLQGTLLSLRNIRSVKITVEGVDLDVPPGVWGRAGSEEVSSGPQADPRVDPRPVVIDEAGRLARLEDGWRLVPVTGVDALAVPGANRPAVSPDGTAFAVLGADRGSLLLQLPGTARAAQVLRGERLTAPSFDPQGWVWTAPATSGPRVWAARTETGTVEVRAPWLAGHQVMSVRASRDGARLLVATRRNGKAFLHVSGVVRDRSTRPLELAPPLSLVPDLVDVTDAAWVAEDQVVALGRRQGPEAQQPWLVQIGGKITGTMPAPGAVSITAGNGELSVMAGSAGGVLARAGTEWERTADGRWPAFPG